uniref:Uncharacterized protein n=1 Tax=Arundo donax TaxID=35708 RepID=A0A0A8ZLI1_ARUDO
MSQCRGRDETSEVLLPEPAGADEATVLPAAGADGVGVDDRPDRGTPLYPERGGTVSSARRCS